MSDFMQQRQSSSWRTRAMLAGGLVGSLLGAGAAYLYVRASEESSGDGGPTRLKTGDGIRIGIALAAIVRQIAELGSRG